MESLNQLISTINGFLWSSVIIALLVGAGFYFTVRTRAVQIRYFGRMFQLIAHTAAGRPREMRFLLSRLSVSALLPE